MMYYSNEQTAQALTQTYAFIKLEVQGHGLRVTLARPEKRNALHPVMVNELAYALGFAQHHGFRTLLLAAEGDYFCAGADLKAFSGEVEETNSTIPEPSQPILLAELFASLHIPCIARIQGPVLAGGFLLMCGCTHVVTTEEATFALPEVKRGLWPMQVMASLLQIMPTKRSAVNLCLSGAPISARAAAQVGLVTHVVAKEDLDKTVGELETRLQKVSPQAVRLGLEALEELKRISPEQQQAYLYSMLMKALQTEDAKEGIAAFKEKRLPKWELIEETEE